MIQTEIEAKYAMKVFIHSKSIGHYALNIGEYSLIISCDWFDNPEKYGIPNNMVIKVYNDHNKLMIKKNKEKERLKVTYIQEENDNELQDLLQVVSVFNQINSLDLFIYCKKDYISILENFSNEHIQYVANTYSSTRDEIESDILVTYGSGIIYFLKQQIPVILIGPYGLGGWITPENFPYLIRSGFAGRGGSTCQESDKNTGTIEGNMDGDTDSVCFFVVHLWNNENFYRTNFTRKEKWYSITA